MLTLSKFLVLLLEVRSCLIGCENNTKNENLAILRQTTPLQSAIALSKYREDFYIMGIVKD